MNSATTNTITAIASVVLLVSALFPMFMGNDTDPSLIDRFVPKVEAAWGKQYIALVKARDFKTAKKSLSQEIANGDLNPVADFFPKEEPKTIKVVGANTNIFNGVTTIALTFEYEFTDKWLLAGLVLLKKDTGLEVEGIHVTPLKDSLEDLTRVTFAGLDLKHYLVFALAILLLLFDVYVLFQCVNTPIPKRKWLWILFILVGIGDIGFNWLTGETYFFSNQAGWQIGVSIPIVGAVRNVYQPLYLILRIPLGAIIFLLMRRKWLVQEQR